MTISAALVKATPNELQYLVTHDGNAGDALALTNAVMAADLVAGPLKDLVAGLDSDQAANSQALARKAMLGDGADVDFNHAKVSIDQRSGLITAMTVDADVDGVSALRNELNIASTSAVAGTAYLRIEFEHSLTR